MKNKKEVTKKPIKLEAQNKLAQSASQSQPVQSGSTQSPKPVEPPKLTPEQQKVQNEMNATIKEIESALYSIRFYPVAVNEESKHNAVKKLEGIYAKGNETVRQLMLYMLHENLATSIELKITHTYDYFKMKKQNLEPSQLRINVYRAMFNYNTSIEGLIETIRLLGRLSGDDAAKLLTYHFSHLCAYESEATHMLRAAILEALGKSDSQYALRALMDYADYSDNDRTFGRIVNALTEWDKRLDKTKLTEPEKDALKSKLKEYMSRDMNDNHYG
ncbi:MAG: hypothetical protein ABID61_02760 [Candidatus Micrarchaeota archaeon]